MDASEENLRNELSAARQEYELALAEMRLAESVYQSLGGQHPDGTQALQNANRKLAGASLKFQEALKRFSDAVLRGAGRQRPTASKESTRIPSWQDPDLK